MSIPSTVKLKKSRPIVILVWQNIIVHFLSLCGVCVNDTTAPLDSDRPQHNLWARVGYFTGFRWFVEGLENALGFLASSAACPAVSVLFIICACSVRPYIWYLCDLPSFQIMFKSALWAQVKATGAEGRWQWLGFCARLGPLLSLMNTSKSVFCQTRSG